MRETDLQTTPHFSRGGPAEAAVGTVWLLLDLVLPVIVFVVVLIVMRSLPLAIRQHIHPVFWFTVAALAAGVVLWDRGLHAVRTIRRSNDITSLPFAPDERHRVRVVCWPDQFEQLRTITADAFEPERFRVALPDARILDITRPAQFVAYFGGVPGLVAQLSFIHPAFAAAMALVAVTATAYLMRLPTYCRFTPGRLEIIRYAPMSTRPVHRQVVDLSAGAVTISTKGLGRVSWTDESGKSRRLPLGLVAGRREAVRSAIAAAVSDAKTPEPESL